MKKCHSKDHDSVKEETETDEEEVVAEGKKLKEMGHKDKSEGDYKSK